jgi:hypothetical protein
MLLDDYLPEFDVRTSYATRIAASPARVYASLWTANFDHWGVRGYCTQYVRSHRFRRDRVTHGAASVTSSFDSALLSTACSRKASLCLRSGPEKNSCSEPWVAFGVPVENCAKSAQFDSVRPPLREPRRRHGTSKSVYGRTAPRSLGPRLEYCARTSRQGDTFARIGC